MHLLLEYFECPEDPRPSTAMPARSKPLTVRWDASVKTARSTGTAKRSRHFGTIDEFLKSLPKPQPEEVGPRPGGTGLVNAGLGTKHTLYN